MAPTQQKIKNKAALQEFIEQNIINLQLDNLNDSDNTPKDNKQSYLIDDFSNILDSDLDNSRRKIKKLER